MKSFGKNFVFVTLITSIFAGSAAAFCGLQSCPRLDPSGPAHPFTAGIRTRATAFNIGDESGWYGTLSPHVLVRVPYVAHLAVGVEVPWITLHTADDAASGLGNPLLTAQYARRLTYDWSAEAGLQLELPLGDQNDGLADDHYMLLPWVGARHDWGTAWYASGMLGFSQAVGGDEEADTSASSARVAARSPSLSKRAKSGHAGHETAGAAPLLVNPHGDREVHWRGAVGYRPLARWVLDGYSLGTVDITESNPVYYTRAGASAEWAVTEAVGLQFSADAPVTSARRSDATVAVDVKVGW